MARWAACPPAPLPVTGPAGYGRHRVQRAPTLFLRLLPALLPAVLLASLPAAAQDTQLRVSSIFGQRVQKSANGVLGLMGFQVVPDMAASSIQVNRSSKEGDVGFSLTQIGSGFTVDPSFPLYLEGFL